MSEKQRTQHINTMLIRIRELLLEGASQNQWLKLSSILGSWKDKDTYDMAVSYVHNHMEDWPDDIKILPPVPKDHPLLPLAIGIKITRKQTKQAIKQLKHLPDNIRYLEWDTILEVIPDDFWENIPHLEVLKLNGTGKASDLTCLAPLRHLRECYLGTVDPYFDFFQASGQLGSLQGIEHCTELEVLHLPCRILETDSLTALSALSKLRELSLLGRHSIPSLDMLASFTELKKLVLNGAGFPPEEHFPPLPNLRFLRYALSAGAQDLQSLHNLSHLEALSLEGGRQGLTNLNGIEELRSLRHLLLSNCYNLERLDELATHRSLEVVQLCEGTLFSGDALQALVEGREHPFHPPKPMSAPHTNQLRQLSVECPTHVRDYTFLEHAPLIEQIVLCENMVIPNSPGLNFASLCTRPSFSLMVLNTAGIHESGWFAHWIQEVDRPIPFSIDMTECAWLPNTLRGLHSPQKLEKMQHLLKELFPPLEESERDA
jgi:hypothetical protein